MSIVSVFVIFGVTPLSESLCPSQFTSVLKSSYFDRFKDKFSLSNFVKTSVNSFSCSESEPFETISISSKKKRVPGVVQCSIHCLLKFRWHIGQPIESSQKAICTRCFSPYNIEITLPCSLRCQLQLTYAYFKSSTVKKNKVPAACAVTI